MIPFVHTMTTAEPVHRLVQFAGSSWSRGCLMSVVPIFPLVEVAVVLTERGGLSLAEFTPRGQAFPLPMSRLRRRLAPGTAVREAPLDAAVRAAATALGRPLPPS